MRASRRSIRETGGNRRSIIASSGDSGRLASRIARRIRVPPGTNVSMARTLPIAFARAKARVMIPPNPQVRPHQIRCTRLSTGFLIGSRSGTSWPVMTVCRTWARSGAGRLSVVLWSEESAPYRVTPRQHLIGAPEWAVVESVPRGGQSGLGCLGWLRGDSVGIYIHTGAPELKGRALSGDRPTVGSALSGKNGDESAPMPNHIRAASGEECPRENPSPPVVGAALSA